LNIGIYIYDEAEVLDFSGPFEVFSTANRLSAPTNIFNVFLIAQTNDVVNARGGYCINPHYGFDDHPDIDVLVVAGGVHDREVKKAQVIEWITLIEKNAKYVSSVCTGAFLLAQAGFLKSKKATTHWQDCDDLQKSYPDVTVLHSQRWVDEGKFITSAGISSGIDMSLYLVSRLVSQELAEKTAAQMEFEWRQNLS